MALKVDFSNVSSGFEVLPEGQYEVEVSKAELKDTKSGDSQYIALTLDVISGEYENRKIFNNLSLKAAAAWKLKEAMVAFNLDAEGEVEFEVEDFVGCACLVALEITTYNGKEQNSVKTYIASEDAVASSQDDGMGSI